ncbi:endonuclease IV [Coprinopsis cinerea AmutBmut pab1-1]|nr:endonuclease IV [Coprinopsis cinerea AmutBmut pab1-1]
MLVPLSTSLASRNSLFNVLRTRSALYRSKAYSIFSKTTMTASVTRSRTRGGASGATGAGSASFSSTANAVKEAEVVARPRKRVKLDKEDTVKSLASEDPDYTDTQALLDPTVESSASTTASPTKKRKPRKTASKTNADEPVDTSSFLPRVKSPWKVGAHVSAAGGVENAVVNAAAIGCNAFALFLKSQRKWTSAALTEESISTFKKRMKEFGYAPGDVLPHGSYLVNLGNPDAEKRQKSYECFLDDVKRCEALGLTLYNFHPGSTVSQTTPENSMSLIAGCINDAHKATKGVTIVLECMAGTGNIIGATFEQLKEIIDQVEDKTRVGVCIDTCHAFSAGYDIRTKEGWNETMDKFERVIGLEYLKGMHLNDSKTAFDSKKDRHENIGLGTIGLASFSYILADPRTRGIPMVLETPSFEKPREVWGVEVEVLNLLSGVGVEGEEVGGTRKLEEEEDEKEVEGAKQGEAKEDEAEEEEEEAKGLKKEVEVDLDALTKRVRDAVKLASSSSSSFSAKPSKALRAKAKTAAAAKKSKGKGKGRKRKARDESDDDDEGGEEEESGCSCSEKDE